MKQRIQTLTNLSEKIKDEARIMLLELSGLKLSEDSGNVFIENLAGINLCMDELDNCIESIKICAEDKNLNLMNMEKEVILKTLQKNNGNITKTAAELGLSVRTMDRRLSGYKIRASMYKIKKCGQIDLVGHDKVSTK